MKKDKIERVNTDSNKKTKAPKKPFSFRFKRWFFGIGKEFSRITWPTGNRIFKDLFVTLVIVIIIALVFLGFDQISGLIR